MTVHGWTTQLCTKISRFQTQAKKLPRTKINLTVHSQTFTFHFFKEKIASRTLRDKVWKQQVDALRHWIAGKCAFLLRNNEAHALMEVGAPVV